MLTIYVKVYVVVLVWAMWGGPQAQRNVPLRLQAEQLRRYAAQCFLAALKRLSQAHKQAPQISVTQTCSSP